MTVSTLSPSRVSTDVQTVQTQNEDGEEKGGFMELEQDARDEGEDNSHNQLSI